MAYFLQELIVCFAAARCVVAVYLYLVYIIYIIGLVHLTDALHYLFGEVLVWFMHAVLSDVDSWDYLDTVGQRVRKRNCGIGSGTDAAVAHHYIEISAVYLFYIILL